MAKARAKRQGVDFDITVDDVRAVWPADGKCPCLGLVLTHGDGVQEDSSASLDRVNPAWGYHKGNLAVISLAANRVKGNATASELESIARWMRQQGLS